MKTGIELIAEERQRQINEEGWTPEHDAQHTEGELANAAAYYAMTEDLIKFIDNEWGNDMHLHIWPFDLEWLKRTPEDRIRELQKAGALIAAEIDRLIAKKEEEQYEYEVFFESKPEDIMKIDGWVPISVDAIKYPEKINEYIKRGILRKRIVPTIK